MENDFYQRREAILGKLHEIDEGLFIINCRLARLEDRIDMLEIRTDALYRDVVRRILEPIESPADD